MKWILILFFIAALFSCEQTKNSSTYAETKQLVQFNVFDTANHLQPQFGKAKFDSLHAFDFGWALLEPINLAKNRNDDKELSKRFSRGQKALYFIWYLDEQVTNGGFVQFYLNDYREYILPIKDGLKLIGDTATLSLVERADNEYLTHQRFVDSYKNKSDWQPLYDASYGFSEFDSIYYVRHIKMMEFLEKYARQNSNEFVKFK